MASLTDYTLVDSCTRIPLFGLCCKQTTMVSIGLIQNATSPSEKYQDGLCFQKQRCVGGSYFKIAVYLFLWVMNELFMNMKYTWNRVFPHLWQQGGLEQISTEPWISQVTVHKQPVERCTLLHSRLGSSFRHSENKCLPDGTVALEYESGSPHSVQRIFFLDHLLQGFNLRQD